MIYRAIGLMSGSSLDGLDLVFAEFTETGGQWAFEILAADCYPYSSEWQQKLKNAASLSAKDYQLLHTAYGHLTGRMVNQFINSHHLQHKVALIASHGHTSFHMPEKKMTAQLGDGAAIAAETGLPVVSDLRAMDMALGGQGAPIVPIGEKLLFTGYDYFLNIGGIANISIATNKQYLAWDVCAANRVLNMLAAQAGYDYDKGGMMAASGTVDTDLLQQLNGLDYYAKAYPKSLANSFGTDIVYPLIQQQVADIKVALRTYVEHIAIQVKNAIMPHHDPALAGRILLTGGGAHNSFLVNRIQALLADLTIEVMVPDEKIVNYKEALIMALIGILRWREEENVIPSVTGAAKGSIGGALWMGR